MQQQLTGRFPLTANSPTANMHRHCSTHNLRHFLSQPRQTDGKTSQFTWPKPTQDIRRRVCPVQPIAIHGLIPKQTTTAIVLAATNLHQPIRAILSRMRVRIHTTCRHHAPRNNQFLKTAIIRITTRGERTQHPHRKVIPIHLVQLSRAPGSAISRRTQCIDENVRKVGRATKVNLSNLSNSVIYLSLEAPLRPRSSAEDFFIRYIEERFIRIACG